MKEGSPQNPQINTVNNEAATAPKNKVNKYAALFDQAKKIAGVGAFAALSAISVAPNTAEAGLARLPDQQSLDFKKFTEGEDSRISIEAKKFLTENGISFGVLNNNFVMYDSTTNKNLGRFSLFDLSFDKGQDESVKFVGIEYDPTKKELVLTTINTGEKFHMYLLNPEFNSENKVTGFKFKESRVDAEYYGESGVVSTTYDEGYNSYKEGK